MRHGAVGAVLVASPQLQIAWSHVRESLLREQLVIAEDEARLPRIIAGPGMTAFIARSLGVDSMAFRSPERARLPRRVLDARIRVDVAVDEREAPLTQNVVAVLEGSDAALKNEYVVFSAHYDHLETESDGEVYNGADDDASGTAAVLEIAQAFAVGPRPSRSVLIVFHTAEELGLLGSEYNTDYSPVVPLGSIVATFNIDMIGRSRDPDNRDAVDRNLTDRDGLYVIGADKLSSELHAISEQTNMDTARLRFDYSYNEDNHPERFYYRSDHYNYAKHGIPVIFYFTGVHRDYHRPTDDVDKIDFEKMERVTRMIFATGWRVANRDARLVVDRKPVM